MKIAILTDTHAGVRNDSLAFHEYSKRFYDDVFFRYIDTNNIRTVIHCGDIVDRRKYINIVTANRLRTDLIEPALVRGIRWHQILGNHDVVHKNTNKISSFIELFNNHNVNIYEEATTVDFDGCPILLMPWINDENRDHALASIKETNAQICFGHLELQGFEMYKGSIVSHGEDASVFSRFDLVASGHYHHRSSRDNIHYLGSHAEFTWSDYNDPRGFHIFDTETRQLSFIENPYKMFVKFWYNDGDPKFTDTPIDYSQFAGKIIKIIITEKNNPYWFEQFVDKIEKQNPVDIQIVEDHLNLNLEDDNDIVDEAESTIDIFKKYIHNTEAKGIDKVKLEQKIVDLYHEALTIE
jgi:DNA repair exonuclease SbcCD nuclease subunit